MPIIEKDEIIIATDYEEIEWILKPIDNNFYGNNSNIYHYKEGLLKVFEKPRTPEEVQEYKRLQKLKTKTMLKTIKDLIINDKMFGYYMPEIKGVMLSEICSNIEINKLLDSLIDVEKDLVLLGKNKIYATDLNVLGIIYNKINNKSTLIDLESFNPVKDSSIEKAVCYNITILYYIVFNVISSIYGISNNTPEFYNYIIYRIFDKGFLSKDIKVFFTIIVNELEDMCDSKISTIDDFRKCLALLKE